MKNHTTNLGYGVKDGRNVDRILQNIDDFVYREEDHEAQKERAAKMRGAYFLAYHDFKRRIVEKAKDLEAVDVI